jgi:hypothetical protein
MLASRQSVCGIISWTLSERPDMKRKPIHPLSIEELEKMSTKQLLARLRLLHQCEESALLSDRDDASNTSETILFKDTPEWTAAYEQVKRMLSLREHVPKGAELAKRRHRRALLSRTIERRAGRRK